MTIVVGCSPDRAGGGALQLAALMARSGGQDLLVISVVPAPWPVGMARIDAEYRTFVGHQADAALDAARAALPADVTATFVTVEARSAAAGLMAEIERVDATYAVMGSSSAGPFGHVALGSVTDRLLHSSPVPIALAPRGLRVAGSARIPRITAAYGGSDNADHLVLAAGEVAARVGADLRLASFAVLPPRQRTIAVGDPEHDVTDVWESEISDYSQRVLEEVAARPGSPEIAESVVGRGRSWSEAIEHVDWLDGEVLVVGSSAVSPAARVFLGSRGAKIVRHSPVPVVVVPHSSLGKDTSEEQQR